MKKKLFFIFCSCILFFSAFAQYTGVVNGINYYFKGKTATATVTELAGYYRYSGNINIPSTVGYDGKKYTVTEIGNRAFKNCTGLTSITLPNTITRIGNNAFKKCTSLTSITLPNKLTNIGYYAFWGCTKITTVTIPNNVTFIGDYAFWGCSELTTVTIPNSVTYIGDYAFAGCPELTTVTIPNSVTIGNYTFAGIDVEYATENINEVPINAESVAENINEVPINAESIAATDYDVIILRSGEQIKAEVMEISPTEVKYKRFEYLNGPIRVVLLADVFIINYKNGTQEVINSIDKTTRDANRQQLTGKTSQGTINCAKKVAFGLDVGLGGSFYANPNSRSEGLFASTLGIRVMHHFNPYLGVDFLKTNWITDVLDNVWTMRLQFMSGIRGNSPTFFKCMSVYSAFRFGYGMDFRLFRLLGLSTKPHFEGLCLETELGLNLTPTVFAGFTYNCQKYFVKGTDSKVAMHTFSFRLGFNFGKIQETKRAR